MAESEVLAGAQVASPEVLPHAAIDHGPEVAPHQPAAAGPEVVQADNLEAFVGRLTALGATLDEVDQVREHWDGGWDDADYTKADLLRASDDELRGMIVGARQEYIESTMTEDEQADRDFRMAVTNTRADAERQVQAGSVDQVLEWAGADRARAQAALEAEQSVPDHTVRKTLVERLEKLAAPPEGS